MNGKTLHTDLLNTTTFWDVDLNLLDTVKDKDFIIVRALERGTDVEIRYIESVYSQQEIIAALERTKGVSKKTLNFYKTITI
ncbi:hypothetical protein K8352_18015 [Flavobacteriaceae bacterium F89]|uniref:DUF6922 domain-containing protein n=1 Tax=Cerina litoralis TaxID=2874477 RepID=A0AAE3EYI5_9FLAO|nr:hypothetical protein [Cerina litoralis]MCG2462663.1 hypothetical protein [Cerina litoralis]